MTITGLVLAASFGEVLLRVVVTVAVAVVTTVISLRLLGGRRGWVTALLAGVAGWTIAILVSLGVNDWDWGADGLVLVAAGAGGHAGTLSPFALVQETRTWFDGLIALSVAIATGRSILAAQAMGADFAYIGTAFIATEEARAAGARNRARTLAEFSWRSSALRLLAVYDRVIAARRGAARASA